MHTLGEACHHAKGEAPRFWRWPVATRNGARIGLAPKPNSALATSRSCYASPPRGWGGSMSKPQRYWLGLFYGAVFVLGAAYSVFQHQEAIYWLTDSMKEIFAFLPLLIL